MIKDLEKHTIEDFGRKLAHLEGVLGAYLPKHVFDSEVQKKTIDCDKFAFSKLRSGKRMAANWELGRFIELFDLARHGFDYQVFLQPFDAFSAALEKAGVGSFGATAAERLREALSMEVTSGATMSIRRDRRLNVGGIGAIEDDERILTLTHRDKVTIRVPLALPVSEAPHFLLLHDFPQRRMMSCLMPSLFAPVPLREEQALILPQGGGAFPVGGAPGYRCLYGVQSSLNLADLIGLVKPEEDVPEIEASQVAQLVDFLSRISGPERGSVHVSFAEYVMK